MTPSTQRSAQTPQTSGLRTPLEHSTRTPVPSHRHTRSFQAQGIHQNTSLRFGGDIRIGDLTGDGTADLLVYRCDAQSELKPCFLGAFTMAGAPLWQTIVDNRREIISRFRFNHSPNETGMEVIHWNGTEGQDLLYNGGALFDGQGNQVVELPGLPPPVGPKKMGWHHAIPADLCGDTREELLLYNPWAAEVFIYTPEPLDESAYRGYSATSRQYNARLMD